MLEMRNAVVSLEAGDLMMLERIITDDDSKEALIFLKKYVYDKVYRAQQDKLKSHIDAANPVAGFMDHGK